MSIRTEKVAAEIKHQVPDVLKREVSDLQLGLITVTRVRVSPDLKNAKIYLSFIGNKITPEQCIDKINFRKKLVRMALSKKLVLRYMPDINFYYDDTIEYADHINELINKIHKDDAKTDDTD